MEDMEDMEGLDDMEGTEAMEADKDKKKGILIGLCNVVRTL